MNKKTFRNLILVVLIGLTGLSVWYLSKPYDYEIRFETKALPGTINQSLKLWVKSLDNSRITESESLISLKQKFKYDDNSYTYHWLFNHDNDSITSVKVGIIDSLGSSTERIANIFQDTKIKQTAIENVKDFIQVLGEHMDSHDVKVMGEAYSPEVYCAFLQFETEQMLKANEMMKNYTYLSNELLKHKIELNGNPMVEIEKWDMAKDSIRFNFCFPIVKPDSLPDHKSIKYKEIKSQKSIKAVYHGNYISSDRAWYELLQYAKVNNMQLINEPIEVYHNNPNFSSDDRNWKTEIYMPIKE